MGAGPPLPPRRITSATIAKLQRVETLLVLLGRRIHLLDAVEPCYVCLGPRRAVAEILLFVTLSQLGESLPLEVARGFAGFGVVLVLGIVVRTVIEQLWIDLHKQLHGVVHHAVDSADYVSYDGRDRKKYVSLKSIGDNIPVPVTL